MVLYFHRFSPIISPKKSYKRGGKLKGLHIHKKALQVLTPENRQFLISLGFQVLV